MPVRCAHCGQTAIEGDPEPIIFKAKLSHLQARIFRSIYAGDGQFVSWQKIAADAYAEDPHGGPEKAANVITAMVHRMRRKLEPLDLSIDGHKGGDGGYRIETKRCAATKRDAA